MNRTSCALLILFVALFCWALGCTPSIDPAGCDETQQTIISGEPDLEEAHGSVVMIRNLIGWCSGTVVAPSVVLTAAHCADVGAVSGYIIYFGNLQEESEETRFVTDVRFHPGWNPVEQGLLNDIALLRLDRPAPAWAKPIPYLPQHRALTPDNEGDIITLVGFGKTNPDPSTHGDIGVKMFVTLPLHTVCVEEEGCPVRVGSFNYYAYKNNICYDQQTAGICSGDSGGPALVKIDGTEYVAGVHSFIAGSCLGYGCSTKVDAFEDFINEFIGSFSIDGQPCTNPAQCLSGYCADGICCESACDLPCQSCSQPKQLGRCGPASDETPCSDGDACNGIEKCLSGECVKGPLPDCSLSHPCKFGYCKPDVGCTYLEIDPGTPCDNQNLCDGPDSCRSGQCLPKGNDLVCDDHKTCTQDYCDPLRGCIHIPVKDYTPCIDDNVCNGQEICLQGLCTLSLPLQCDDNNTCTQDSCDKVLGCRHEPLTNGASCGNCRTCQDGLCLPDDHCSSTGCTTTSIDPDRTENWFWFLALFSFLWLTRSRTSQDGCD